MNLALASASRRSGFLLLGPAFVAAIAYVDPGNVAANVSAGAQFGFLLVWVILVANAMAGLVQYLSAKLGLVTGRSLPEAVADHTRRRTRLAYWVQAELVAMATDLAEVVGGAIALYLLFDLPLLLGGVITGVVSLILLSIQNRRGQQVFERVITGLMLVIAIGFLTSLAVEPPAAGDAGQLASPALIGRLQGGDRAGDVGACRQALGEILQAQWPGGGEQQGLDLTLGVGAHGRSSLRARR